MCANPKLEAFRTALSLQLDVQAEVKLLLQKYDLDLQGWRFDFNQRRSSYGLCSYRKKTIYLSLPLLPHLSREAWLDTLRHEVAHALTPGAGHGPVWRAACRRVGARPTPGSPLSAKLRGDSDPVAVEKLYRFKLTCPKCEKSTFRTRTPKKGARYGCASCSPTGRFDARYELKITALV